MAVSVPLLSEDQLLCPICLGVFVEPVSTPCGHNFCKSCLSSYWNSSSVCLCPVCKESFSIRPQLRVNTFISGLCQSFNSLQLTQEPQTSVLCDVFTAPPDSSLQDRVCPQHQQLLRSYCTEERALLCVSCEGTHSKHRTLPLEQAYRELRVQLEPREAKVSSLIQERVQRVCSIKETQAQRQQETRRVITHSEQVLQDVLKKVQNSYKDLVQKMEEKQQQDDSEAEALVLQSEQDIADLLETQNKLQELKQTDDPLLFLQRHSNMSSVRLSKGSTLSSGKGLEELRKSLKKRTSCFKDFLEKLDGETSPSNETESVLNPLLKYAVDLKLDPDTASPWLVLSRDLRQVRFTKRRTQASLNNSRRFLGSYCVTTDKGFSYGRFYFEVSVENKEEWILGLIAQSVPRKKAIPKEPNGGVWALYFRVDKFYTSYNRIAPVHVGKVDRVGVYVDCEKGLLSFYDAMTVTHIYTFNNFIFEEKMYPFLNPCDDEFPSNFGPMTLVNHK